MKILTYELGIDGILSDCPNHDICTLFNDWYFDRDIIAKNAFLTFNLQHDPK